jgi:hypothetical protein
VLLAEASGKKFHEKKREFKDNDPTRKVRERTIKKVLKISKCGLLNTLSRGMAKWLIISAVLNTSNQDKMGMRHT